MLLEETGKKEDADWANRLMKGENQFADISEKKVKEMHSSAYILYQNEQYQESSYFFRLLAMSRPSEPKFWKGLGACLQMQKDYQEALNCFTCCFLLTNDTPPDPYLYLQAADCYFALKEVSPGLQALEAAHASATKLNDKRVLRHVAFMREQWSQDNS